MPGHRGNVFVHGDDAAWDVSGVRVEGAAAGCGLGGGVPAAGYALGGVARVAARSPQIAVPVRVPQDAVPPGSCVVHDAVVAAAGAGAGAVPGEHLGEVQPLSSIRSRSAPPRSSQVWLKWCRTGAIHAHPALPAAAGDDLVDAGRGERHPLFTPSHSCHVRRSRRPAPHRPKGVSTHTALLSVTRRTPSCHQLSGAFAGTPRFISVALCWYPHGFSTQE